MPKAKTTASLKEILQQIREKGQGWESLTPDEQMARRTAIYGLRCVARKAAKAEGLLGKPEFPPIPKVDLASEQEEGTEDPETEEGPITLESVKESVSSLKRQIWLVMADTEDLTPSEQLEVARDLDSLARSAGCGASVLSCASA